MSKPFDYTDLPGILAHLFPPEQRGPGRTFVWSKELPVPAEPLPARIVLRDGVWYEVRTEDDAEVWTPIL